MAFAWAGDLGSGSATLAACAAILILGLPHGALDLALLRQHGADATGRWAELILTYAALAGIALLLWAFAPGLGLALFLANAALHFAEDWEAAGSRFLALGLALATICAPGLLNLAQLEDLFAILVPGGAGEAAAQALRLLAPASLLVAAIAILRLWQLGGAVPAVQAIATLAGMLVLPPLIGFALYFCALHSPTQFRAAHQSLPQTARPLFHAAAATLGAFALAAVLFLMAGGTSLPSRAVAATFVTLAVLTVPHTLMPAILRRWQRPTIKRS
nr:beta-carotene 15,15'-dioxygenase, Brp/Blh family [Qipengyuania citrea]